jgi:hypothetical protein
VSDLTVHGHRQHTLGHHAMETCCVFNPGWGQVRYCFMLLQGVLVKLYELNCWKLYTSTQAEADLNLELAGVAPTHTITLNTPADPLVRWAWHGFGSPVHVCCYRVQSTPERT